jgi:hypothetical protein
MATKGSLTALVVLAAALSTPAVAKPRECAPGRFLLVPKTDAPLRVATADEVIVLGADGTLSVGSDCPPVAAQVSVRRKSTAVRAVWRGSCGSAPGRTVRFRGRIAGATCDTLTGALRGRAARPHRRRLVAHRSWCGDGIGDPGGGEECEPTSAGGCGSECRRLPPCDGGDCTPAAGAVEVNVTDPTYGAKCDGVTDDRAKIQTAIDVLAFFGPGILRLTAQGGVNSGTGKLCALAGSLHLRSGVHVRGEGSGGLKALSTAVGNGMLFDNGTQVVDASVADCVLDANGQDGVEAIRLVTRPTRLRIDDNRFQGGRNAFAVDVQAAAGGTGVGQNMLRGNIFVGSNDASVNDSGININCGRVGLVVALEPGCLIADTSMARLGGQGIHTMAAAGASGVQLANIDITGVHRENIFAETAISGSNVSLSYDGVNNGAPPSEEPSLRPMVRLKGGASSFVNLGIGATGRKNLIEGAGVLSLTNGLLAGGAVAGITSGTAGAASTSTKVVDATQTWTANKWKDFEVVITPGNPGCALPTKAKRWITASTGTELQWAPPLPSGVSAASCAYSVTGGGMVVVRGSFSAAITGFQWDNAAAHTLVDTDQLVLVDVANASVHGNVFSLIHSAGHNAVRFVSTGTGTIPVSGPISLESNTILHQCTAPECLGGTWACFLFDEQQAAGGFQNALISGNNIGASPTCVPVAPLAGFPGYGKIATDNLGF